MKKIVFTSLFLLIALQSLGQQKHLLRPPTHPPTEAQLKLEERNNQCVHRNTYTAAQRLKFYPFNKAVQVKLVSFNGDPEPNELLYTDDVPKPQVKVWKYPFENGKIDTSRFIEGNLLTKVQIDKLTDILYNIGYKEYRLILDAGANCYNPRNAILFIDEHGKIFAYIEICFECERYVLKPQKIKVGQFCTDKFRILKDYFASIGIEYGVTKQNRRSYN